VRVRFDFDFATDAPLNWPRFADVPPSGAKLRMGEPVCTVFASGQSSGQCRERVLENAARMLGGPRE
jgi:predicted ATP-grasp superfamily ATP-dependent carboligase